MTIDLRHFIATRDHWFIWIEEHVRPLRHLAWVIVDVSYGWGPSALGWEDAGRFAHWFHRWYWRGMCSECEGAGTLHVIYRQGAGEVDEYPVCPLCRGDGRYRGAWPAIGITQKAATL